MNKCRVLIFALSLVFNAGCRSRPPEMAAATAPTARIAVESRVLAVTSWNVKHLGREVFDSAQASPLLSDADIVTFQEVNTSDKGKRALAGIAAQLQKLIPSERFCMGLSDPPRRAKERYAFLWKNSRVAYVKSDGEVMTDCPPTALTVRLSARNAENLTRPPAVGTFYFKPASRMFVLASVHLPPAKKKPQLEVAALFDSFTGIAHPLIVAGDFNLAASHESFGGALLAGFRSVLGPEKTSLRQNSRELSKAYDNFWFRNVQLAPLPQGKTRVLNLYEIFPEKNQKEIYDNFSDHCPIVGHFELQ